VAELRIKVFGSPAPQGSKRHVGRGQMVESSKHVGPWRDAVRAAALGAIRCCDELDCSALRHPFPLTGPLAVRMVFSVARPKGHYRTGRNAHLLRDSAPLRPASPPDLSKYLRSSEDALTDAYVYKDDGQIVEYHRAAKVYCGEDPEALDAPGALIVVRTLTDPLDPAVTP
jgi:Holliday junction resolvase RusA-like endonuclease